MAARNQVKTRMKPHYVRTKKGKGTEPSTLFRRVVTILLLLLVLAGIVYGTKQGFDWLGRKLYSENPTFELQRLAISCDGQLTEDRIREYTGLREGANLFALSFKKIENDLLKVPVVESVYLERKLPGTLVVKVKERVPVAQVSGAKARKFPFVVDRFGYVLPPRQSAATLPIIQGIDTELRLGEPVAHPDVGISLNIIALCESTSYLRTYVRIETLDVKYSDFIDMRLQGDIRVRMPRFSLKPKLQQLASVIKIANGQGRRVKEVDLTLDSAKVPVTYY